MTKSTREDIASVNKKRTHLIYFGLRENFIKTIPEFESDILHWFESCRNQRNIDRSRGGRSEIRARKGKCLV